MYKAKQSPDGGLCIDYSKLHTSIFIQVLRFAITGPDTKVLCVDPAKMPLQLIQAIALCIIPDTNTPITDHNCYQDGPHKKSWRFQEQSSPDSEFTPINNPPCTNHSGKSQFHLSVPVFQPSPGTIFQGGSSSQYINSGVMQTFYQEVWGNHSAILISEFDVNMQQPQFYIDPQYSDIAEELLADELQACQLHLNGISDKVQSKLFLKVHHLKERKLHPVSSSIIVWGEYIHIEKLVEETVSLRWAELAKGKNDTKLDYKVSRQPGYGTYRVLYVSPHNC